MWPTCEEWKLYKAGRIGDECTFFIGKRFYVLTGMQNF
jgi:hypothetical protein